MRKYLNLKLGQKFGRLTFITTQPDKMTHGLWLCDCGQYKVFRNTRVKCGYRKDCGCTWRKNSSKRFTKLLYKHGFNSGKINRNLEMKSFYSRWENIHTRCNNKARPCFKYYGGRGIKVCNAWNNFINFKNDMWEGFQEHCKTFGIKNTEIDRKNVNGNYELSNCRWVTEKEQHLNRRDSKSKKKSLIPEPVFQRKNLCLQNRGSGFES